MSLVYIYNDANQTFSRFTENGRCKILKQPHQGAVDDFAREAAEFRPEGLAACAAMTRLTGIDFELGDNKAVRSAFNKACGLDGSNITDYVRGRGWLDHPSQVGKILSKLDPNTHAGPIMIGDAKLVALENNFETPKTGGLRCLHMLFEIEKPDGRRHVMELQARVRDMAETEELTHQIYDAARQYKRGPHSYTSDPENMVRVQHKLGKMANYYDQVRDYLHSNGYKQGGWDQLLLDKPAAVDSHFKRTDAYRVMSRKAELSSLVQSLPT